MGFFAGPAPIILHGSDTREPTAILLDDGHVIYLRHEPRRIAQQNPNPQTSKPNIRLQRPQPATGATTRLPRTCQHCRDELPSGARFCITCGQPV